MTLIPEAGRFPRKQPISQRADNDGYWAGKVSPYSSKLGKELHSDPYIRGRPSRSSVESNQTHGDIMVVNGMGQPARLPTISTSTAKLFDWHVGLFHSITPSQVIVRIDHLPQDIAFSLSSSVWCEYDGDEVESHGMASKTDNGKHMGCLFFAVHEASSGFKGAGTWYLALASACGILMYEAPSTGNLGISVRKWIFFK